MIDPEILLRLGVAPADAAEFLTSRRDPRVDQVAAAITPTVGRRDLLVPLPEGDPFFYAHVAMTLLPTVRAYHRERGVPDDISWRTLGALGSNFARYRRIYGRGGLDGVPWVVRVYRGLVFHVGRLVFERARVGPVIGPGRPDDNAIGVHIPPTGPLSPEACDDAFAGAKAFFEQHFPNENPELARCRSWLLDPTLAEYLGPNSNIVKFGRRFHLVEHDAEPQSGDRAIVRWVFEVPDPADYAALTGTTTLERAVLRHLRSGGHWREQWGWLPWP